MANDTPLILVTNDDGVSAKGIRCLVDCIGREADVVIAAPALPQSGKSSALTVGAPLHINEHDDYHGARVFSITGTPVDCVKLAMHSILPKKPDMVLSGINHGSNAGVSVTYSGTMGAVLEGCMNGIPSIGFSLLHHSLKADFSMCAKYVTDIIEKTFAHPLPYWVSLNVNMPSLVVPKGVKVCRAARGHWSEEYKRYLDPSGNPFYWLTGRFVNAEPEATDTDEYWLQQSYISVVPVTPEQTIADAIAPFAEIYEEN